MRGGALDPNTSAHLIEATSADHAAIFLSFTEVDLDKLSQGGEIPLLFNPFTQ